MTDPGYSGSDELRYREVLAAHAKSPTLRGIWSGIYGDDYPSEAEPFGFITLSDLRRIAGELKVGSGDRFIDLGCGTGGPGLWLARETGAGMDGIDIVEGAVRNATLRAESIGMAGRARFHTGSLVSAGLPAGSFDAAVSIDAFWMVLNKPAAFREAGRLVRPGARLVLTTWEPEHIDHTRMARKAGFDVVECVEPPDWRRRQIAVYEAILRLLPRLASEMGGAAAAILGAEAREAPDMLSRSRRILLIADKVRSGA